MTIICIVDLAQLWALAASFKLRLLGDGPEKRVFLEFLELRSESVFQLMLSTQLGSREHLSLVNRSSLLSVIILP